MQAIHGFAPRVVDAGSNLAALNGQWGARGEPTFIASDGGWVSALVAPTHGDQPLPKQRKPKKPPPKTAPRSPRNTVLDGIWWVV